MRVRAQFGAIRSARIARIVVGGAAAAVAAAAAQQSSEQTTHARTHAYT